jgi:hypothetical protein
MFRITEDQSSGSLVQCLVKITKMDLSCPLNGHDRTVFVNLANHCTRLPDDGSSTIRNTLENF